MLAAILSVRSLLLAIFMLMAGSGFLATLLGLRLEASGTSAMLIGLVAASYFVGLTVGSLQVSKIIRSVGHIRAFAAFVSLFSASTLTYAVHQDVLLWAGLRFVDGLCMAGVFICLESWLNERAEPEARGVVLAAYMIFLYAGQALGQFLLNLSDTKPSMPFMAAAILLSLAVIPVVLTRIASPSVEDQAPLSVGSLYRVSPLGMVGANVTGLMLGAFYGLGAVYARRLGMDLATTALFMSSVILGGVALQWPLGRLSDRFDRRKIIVLAFVGAASASLLIALVGTPGPGLMLIASLFGGMTFALYPLCVAHTNDHLTRAQRVGASGGLVLVYSIGAAAGPLAGAAAMSAFGPKGLFLLTASCAAIALAFAFYRQWSALPVPDAQQQPYQILPRTTPMSAVLDPLAPTQAAKD
ncbi:MFS transporter [Sphingosinicella rhizophila]|uniref:MFS transporter n=1 Tax=Sphingosinicella rhizophila TaxID=3050082 RepID=A0ABU3Q6R0_9SPHN|nr:MFS transporter [Sphingosinicella sp. GR2756]MDT9599090.1 MFS transporter [Sphingosinicella sp. GR2756]